MYICTGAKYNYGMLGSHLSVYIQRVGRKVRVGVLGVYREVGTSLRSGLGKGGIRLRSGPDSGGKHQENTGKWGEVLLSLLTRKKLAFGIFFAICFASMIKKTYNFF